MAGKSPLEDPLGHSTDTDHLHFPGGHDVNVHEATDPLLGGFMETLGLTGLTKYMMLVTVAAVFLIVVLPLVVGSIRRNGRPKGPLANFFEVLLNIVRNDCAISGVGKKHADQFLPYLWTVFFFILVCNLLGMIPSLGSPTAALGCTMALALCSFVVAHTSGIKEQGLAGYAHSFVPTVPAALYPLMLVIEVAGNFIKFFILAIRLFANLLAGHTVLYLILGFIYVVGVQGIGLLYFLVTPASVVAVVLLSFLEIFVAFLQAYVFTFLSAIFIGAAVHPHH